MTVSALILCFQIDLVSELHDTYNVLSAQTTEF